MKSKDTWRRKPSEKVDAFAYLKVKSPEFQYLGHFRQARFLEEGHNEAQELGNYSANRRKAQEDLANRDKGEGREKRQEEDDLAGAATEGRLHLGDTDEERKDTATKAARGLERSGKVEYDENRESYSTYDIEPGSDEEKNVIETMDEAERAESEERTGSKFDFDPDDPKWNGMDEDEAYEKWKHEGMNPDD